MDREEAVLLVLDGGEVGVVLEQIRATVEIRNVQVVDGVLHGSVRLKMILDLLGIIGLRIVIRNHVPLYFVISFDSSRMDVIKQVLQFDIKPVFE
tara:strand:+ start:374 stop:658 length:285 start_codon:yes stop_codon:yes gene_type:complete